MLNNIINAICTTSSHRWPLPGAAKLLPFRPFPVQTSPAASGTIPEDKRTTSPDPTTQWQPAGLVAATGNQQAESQVGTEMQGEVEEGWGEENGEPRRLGEIGIAV